MDRLDLIEPSDPRFSHQRRNLAAAIAHGVRIAATDSEEFEEQ
jgi:hypothetical protein